MLFRPKKVLLYIAIALPFVVIGTGIYVAWWLPRNGWCATWEMLGENEWRNGEIYYGDDCERQPEFQDLPATLPQ